MFFGGCSCAGMCHSNLDAHFDCFPFSLPLVSFANASTNLNLKDILPKSSQANSCKAYSNIYIINLLWYFSVQIAFLVVPFKIPGTKLNGTWDVCVAQFFRNANNFQLLWFHNIGNVYVLGIVVHMQLFSPAFVFAYCCFISLVEREMCIFNNGPMHDKIIHVYICMLFCSVDFPQKWMKFRLIIL